MPQKSFHLSIQAYTHFFRSCSTMTTPANATSSAATHCNHALAAFNVYQTEKANAVKEGEDPLSCTFTLATAAKQCVRVLSFLFTSRKLKCEIR